MTDFTGTTHRTVAWLKQALDAGQLELRPIFQRNLVWLDPQKSALIDTILRGYPIPELYMQDVTDSEGQEKHYVIDGQQRITACMEFVNSDFELKADESPDWAEMSYEDLSEADRKKIWSYAFVTRVVPPIAEGELREVFKRINKYNMSLTNQELRHATYWGEFISSMESLADDEFWVSSGVFSANDFRRMLDVEFISELAISVLHGPQNKKASLDRWYQTYEEEFEDRALVEQVFEEVLGELGSILPDLKETRWRRASDFYTLFTTFAAHHKDLPLSSEKRDLAGEKLRRFGEQVTAALATNPPSGVTISKRATKYAEAVQRAASDLARRKERTKQLEAALSGVW
ncbi:MAG: DUF262 domain-containing protein [Actinomycetota bacterium]